MAKNYVAEGKSLDVLLAADCASGDAIIIGDKVGVAFVDGKSGETITCLITGVWIVPKGADTIAQCATVYAKADGTITTTATDNTKAGVAYAAAATGDATVQVLLG